MCDQIVQMAQIFGVFEAQAFVVFVVALVGLVPVVLYRETTSNWFLAAFGFLFVAAFTTNFENLFLPGLMNGAEHVLGNMGAGIGFAVAAYMYRKENIEGDADEASAAEGG